MKEFAKQLAITFVVVVVIIAGMLWLTCGQEIQQATNAEWERQGWQPIFRPPPEPIRCEFTISRECMVAKTQIVSEDALELSGNIFFSKEHTNHYSHCWFAIYWGGYATILVTLEYDPPPTGERFRYHVEIGVRPEFGMPGGDYTEWYSDWYLWDDVPDIDWAFSIKSTHSRLHRSRIIEPWRGSTVGPTHTVESRFTDEWVSEEPYNIVITFGELQWSTNAHGISPDTQIWVEHQLHWPAADTEFVRLTLNCSTFPFDFTAIEDHCYGQYMTAPKGTNPGAGDMWVEGSGNVLTFQSGTPPSAQHPYIDHPFNMPRTLDLRQAGLCGWGDLAPNDDLYGSVLMWLWDGTAVCPVWHYQNGPLWTPGDPWCTALPGTYPAWAGPTLNEEAGAGDPPYSPPWNPLDAYCPFCGSQLRPGGMMKVPWAGSWPDTSETDWVSVGAFQDGTEAPLSQSQLHSLFAEYTQRIYPYQDWDFKAAYTPAFELWNPFGGGATLLIDRKSGRTNKLPLTVTAVGGIPIIPVHVGGCDSTDCHSDPFYILDADDVSTDVDTPEGTRPSAWESTDFAVTGGEVGSSGDVIFTVPVDGGTLYRGPLINPYFERNAFMIANSHAGAFPNSHDWHRANATPGGGWPGGWNDTDCMGGDHAAVDVTWYQSSRWLHMLLEATDEQDLTELDNLPQLRLTYAQESVTYDSLRYNSMPPLELEITAEDSAEITYSPVYYTNANILAFDLLTRNRPRLQHVSKIELLFPPGAMGGWKLHGIEMRQTDPETDGIAIAGEMWQPGMTVQTVHEAHHAYLSGGLEAHVDGKVEEVMRCTGLTSDFIWHDHRPLVPLINEQWSFDEEEGSYDVSTAYGLETFCTLLSRVGECRQVAPPENWESIYRDEDGAVLTIGYSFDIREAQDYQLEIGFRGWLWQGVAGLLYRPHGVLCVQGNLHGISTVRNAIDYVRIFRRPAGSEDEWELARLYCTDCQTYWPGLPAPLPEGFGEDPLLRGLDLVYEYEDIEPILYEYRAGVSPHTDFERLWERQWDWAWIGMGRQPDLVVDTCGRLWLARNDGSGNIQIFHRDSPQRPWQTAANAFSEGAHEHPSMLAFSDGRFMVFATRIGAKSEIAESRDYGRSWSVLS